MSDYDRGAYAPHSDAPLAFDAREPRARRPAPFSLILGLIVLAVLAAALALLYRGGVRSSGDGPPTVGQPVGEVRSAPAGEAAPAADPALRLDVYDDRDAAPVTGEVAPEPTFTPAPEEPLARATGAAASSRPPGAAPTTAVAPAAATTAAAATPPRATPATARPAASPTIASVLAASEASAGASSGGGASVQIGAFSSAALANTQLAAVRGATPGGSGVQVEPVERNGSTLYRGLVTGFASRAEAQAYCARLQQTARSCLVR